MTKTRRLVLDALPNTQADVARITGLNRDSVSRCLKNMEPHGMAHLAKLIPAQRGGKARHYWAAGPKPKGHVVRALPQSKHAERVAKWRASKVSETIQVDCRALLSVWG